MQLSRRAFIASLTGALVAPRLALPAPPARMIPEVAPEVIAFQHITHYDPIVVHSRVVLYGLTAKAALERDPHLWSVVMVNKQIV